MSVPGRRAKKAGAVIARAADRLPELDAVLGLEVAARQIIGAGKRDEGDLPLLIQRPRCESRTRRRQRPVRIERQRAAADAGSGLAMAMFGRAS